MWPRSRSKSSTSTASSIDTAPSPPTVPVPALPSPPVLRLDPPSFAPIPDDADVTPISQLPHPQSLFIIQPTCIKIKTRCGSPPPASRSSIMRTVRRTHHRRLSSFLCRKLRHEGRPASWMSVSSTGSSMAPSPLFDKSIFDAVSLCAGDALLRSRFGTYEPASTQPLHLRSRRCLRSPIRMSVVAPSRHRPSQSGRLGVGWWVPDLIPAREDRMVATMFSPVQRRRSAAPSSLCEGAR
ncbi:hypothetical protein C8F01DRAFT_413646 [Mycena amicta]|nr:hypothetical protein C8F01DRAFT_413646 [Mycena amicta]